MKRKIILLAILIAVSLISSFAQTKKGIICLTYDDGLATQLSTAIPQLDSLGLKATFFLNSIQGSSQSDIIGQTPEAVLGWVNAAKHGHELGNHTLFHPCPEKLGWDKSIAIDTYSLDRIVDEITTENAILSALDPHRKVRSFAFPCNNVFVQGIDYSKIIKDKGLVAYARTGGDSTNVITDFKYLNPMQVPAWQVLTGTSLKELIAYAEKVRKTGGMGVYIFHGIGGQIFQIPKETHLLFLKYLKSHEADYWVTTFSEAVEYISKKKP
jgi:peptidoglycan/xylan/chitin deacetylase (PgdA/CDA1 family)